MVSLPYLPLAVDTQPRPVPQETLSKLLSLDAGISPREWLVLAEYYGLRAALVIVLLTLAWTMAGWLTSVVKTSLLRLKFDETLTLFLAKLTWWGVMGLAALACLSKFGVETTSFAAVIGAGGLAIGLAFQGTLSNFAAGAMLLIFRPYKVADFVNIAGHLGRVAEIELFTTSIDTTDNRRIIIPNSSIFGAVIENITHNRNRRVEVLVGVSYSADIDETRRVLEEAAQATAGSLFDPPLEVILTDLASSSVNWSVRVWCRTPDYIKVKQALIREIKIHLDRAGLEIPYPQMDLHVRSTGAVSLPISRAA
jgi:small conductance mechanosensitive channel